MKRMRSYNSVREMVNCLCEGHRITVDRDDDDPEITVSMWTRIQGPCGWLRRFGIAWRVIVSGYQAENETVLSQEEANKLADLLRGDKP